MIQSIKVYESAPAQVGGQGGHLPPLEFPGSSNITYFYHFEH